MTEIRPYSQLICTLLVTPQPLSVIHISLPYSTMLGKFLIKDSYDDACTGDPYVTYNVSTPSCTVTNSGSGLSVVAITIPVVGASSGTTATASPSSGATVKPGAPTSVPNGSPPSPVQFPTQQQSVQSSTSSTKACFSGSETVTLESGGSKVLSEVVLGDRILTSDAAGDQSYSEVGKLGYIVV
jgi:Hint module